MPKADHIDASDYDTARLVSTILTLYYVEELTQAEIAQRLDLSMAKVNRLLQQARRQGLIEIAIRTPFQHLFDLEARLRAVFGLTEAIVVPAVSEGTSTMLHMLGRAGADFLLDHLRDGDVIAISGGTAVHAVMEALDSPRAYDVQVVPILGGVQGNVTTDMNYLAIRLAERLGGRAYQLHAPAFVEGRAHRDMLLSIRPVKDILDIARQANIALLGVGTVDYETSRFGQMTALSADDMKRIGETYGGVGEMAGHIFNIEGRPCAEEYADRVVGLSLQELKRIPFRIGVTATRVKAMPLYGALRGSRLHALITDEVATRGVMELFERDLRATGTQP